MSRPARSASAASRTPPAPSAQPQESRRAERWTVDLDGADVATLDIPASAHHRRVFEIDVRFVVRAPESADGRAWHALTVELDGAREWTRRIPTHAGGTSDSLDYHCRRELMPGQALRVRALTQVGGAQRLRLSIEAEEQF